MSIDDPLIGKKLGDYTIQSLLGRGGMSRVYKGYDENLQRYAAVKVISGDFATTTEEEYTRRFQSEARAIAHLRHSNIVGVYQFGRVEGIYYMAQVFLEGKDLRQLLKEYAEKGQRMPPPEILRIVGDVAGALDYAHEQGVIHRDIKPSNIMLEKRTGRAILMDFGLALSVHEGTMGDTFGSAHYIAPEQAVSSAKAVPQSDLYSLGIVIYEMVTGKVPFDDPSVMSVALKHLNELPPPPTMYNPDLPSGVEAVIMRVLDKDASRRYETGQAMVTELEKAFAGTAEAAAEIETGTAKAADKQPTAPTADKENQFVAHPKPRISTASARPERKLGGLAGRFARRKAKREEEAELASLGETGLQIDDDTLGSLLDSMPDPSEIGLVGEAAKGIASKPQQSAPESSQPLARMLGDAPTEKAEEPAAEPEVKRRSRVGVLLPVILLLSILAAALYFGSPMDNDGDSEDGTAQAAVVLTETAEAAGVTIGDLTGTVEATEEPTGEPTEAPTNDAATQMATSGVTGEATEEPTEEPTSEPTEELTGEATEESTGEPTAQPSETPTVESTQESVSTPEDTPSVEPTSDEATAVAMVVEPALYKPNIRLIYDDEALLLLNVSGKTIDISQLIFEQILPDGERRIFRSTTWQDDVIDPPDEMRSDSCYQLVASPATQANPEVQVCPLFQGYFRTNVPQRYFWISSDPDATFTVRIEGETQPVATCSIAAGECEFYAGPEDEAELIEPTEMPPSGITEEEPNIRLIYDRETFMLVNISEEALNISSLLFEQELPTGSVRVFLAAEWDEQDLVGSTSSVRAGGCYQLITSEGAWYRPDREVCESFLGWFRSNLSERYFWRSTRSDASFVVRFQDGRTPLAICQISAGECFFYMPPPEE